MAVSLAFCRWFLIEYGSSSGLRTAADGFKGQLLCSLEPSKSQFIRRYLLARDPNAEMVNNYTILDGNDRR